MVPRTHRYNLTGRPWARSTYTKSAAADGTTLFWYDCWAWYCSICRKWEIMSHREREIENCAIAKLWLNFSYNTNIRNPWQESKEIRTLKKI